jgi:hypothetical protein
MVPRSELINVVDGAGRLEVRGTVCAFGLFVDDRHVTANWFDLAGSIAQSFYRVADCSVERSAAMARDAVRDALNPAISLADPFWPLLNQFVFGPYRLDYDEAGSRLHFHEPQESSESCMTQGVYGYAHESLDSRSFLPTQHPDDRDEQRILDWAGAIEAGVRPTVVTTTIDAADSEFIVDGHHKLAAYRLADVPPRRLAIVALAPRPLQSQDWPGGRLSDPPTSWRKASALRQLPWPANADAENRRRTQISKRLGAGDPHLIGFLTATHAYVSEYSSDFTRKEPRGWCTSPAKLELLNRRVEMGSDGCDIIKVAVVESQRSSDPGLMGWVPLMATTFIDHLDIKTRRIKFDPYNALG